MSERRPATAFPANEGPDRRELLTACVLGLAASALACSNDKLHPKPGQLFDAPRELPPWNPVPSGGPALELFAVGDVGLVTTERDAVARRMAEHASVVHPDSILLLGDNFYFRGVTSTDDSQWQEKFELAYPSEAFDLPFHAALGNHDHNGSVQAQVDYSARSARWRMPSRYYSFVRPIDEHTEAAVFVADTTALLTPGQDASDQLRWLEDELARCRASWKLVVGHHPVLSSGGHGATPQLATTLRPMLARHGVHAYLSGHDHDLELVRTDEAWVQVVSGAGSSTRNIHWRPRTLFADARPGFVRLSVRPSEMWIEFVLAESGPVFTHRVAKA